MRISRGVSLAGLCLVLLSGSCAYYTPTVRPGAPYKPASAYLFGRFMLNAGYSSLGFEIRCRDEKTYTITFSRSEALQMIEVSPSICQIDHIIYYSKAGPVPQLAAFRLIRNEFIEPGGVYYLGDFVGSNATDMKVMLFATRWTQSWKFGAARNNYEGATTELKQNYPGFAAVATEDRSTISRRPSKPH